MGHFERVAVLGYGTMGRGIAQLVAASGSSVVVYEPEQARLTEGDAAVGAFLTEGVERGKLTPEQRRQTLDRLRTTTEIEQLDGTDLVIEAIVEDRDAKAELWPLVADVVGTQAVLTTNTSALSVTDLAALVPRPERFAGLHFFHPAPLMGVIEIVRALRSDDEVLAALEVFCSSLGKSSVVVADRPGFLVNRLLMPYLNDVIQAYDDGLASAHDIDTAVELGLGHPMGPMAILDAVGLDTHERATTAAYQQLHDPRFAAPPLLARMVSAGHLGDKSGRGFRAGGGLDLEHRSANDGGRE